MSNPLTANRLRTRDDLQAAVRELFNPLAAHLSPGGAWILPQPTRAGYTVRGAGMEGFARPLWGLAPLAVGGGTFEHWDIYHRGLANGADRDHAEYWGSPPDYDQRFVEAASLGFALAVAPRQVWEPLAPAARKNLARWLNHANERPLYDNNWLFFRVLANLGLARVGAAHDPAAMHAALDRLESFYLGDGWYGDGPAGRCDYYNAFAMHAYGLIYATLAGDRDPARAQRFRDRAALFATDFIHWFAANGAAIPFGRSLTYRFAQGSFWSALAYANIEVFPWGVIKGLLMRHLRWWVAMPIFTPDGVLSTGYGYPNPIMAEAYNGPGASYWAMKAFLPLALPASHPFWLAEEAPLPELPEVHAQKQPGMIVCRDGTTDHVVALAAAPRVRMQHRHTPEKYLKFAYSTHFAFNVPCGHSFAADSMLAVSDDGVHYRVREENLESRIDGGALYARWSPYPGVTIETWLHPAPGCHRRIHHIETDRELFTLEGGFPLNVGGDLLEKDLDPPHKQSLEKHCAPGFALVRCAHGCSALRDADGRRTGEISPIEANLNLLSPRVAYPILRTTLPPGKHTLTCDVLGSPRREAEF